MAQLKDRIASDLKEAMRARDQLRLDTLRSAISGFTYKRSEAGAELSDADKDRISHRGRAVEALLAWARGEGS